MYTCSICIVNGDAMISPNNGILQILNIKFILCNCCSTKFECNGLFVVWIVDLACFRLSHREKNVFETNLRGGAFNNFDGRKTKHSKSDTSKSGQTNPNNYIQSMFGRIFQFYLFLSINKKKEFKRDPKLSKIFCCQKSAFSGSNEEEEHACKHKLKAKRTMTMTNPRRHRKGKCNQAKSVTKMKKGLQKRQATHV